MQVVQYDRIQFAKTDAVLRGMGLELGKSDRALAELRAKGLAWSLRGLERLLRAGGDAVGTGALAGAHDLGCSRPSKLRARQSSAASPGGKPSATSHVYAGRR